MGYNVKKGDDIMPKRNTIPVPYKDAGKNPDELLVQKSNPLLSLTETDMTLPEFKILDAYLARIDSHNDERRTVVFEKGKMEELLGVTKISQKDLKERLKNLYKVVELEDETLKNGFRTVGLFEEATASQDEDGLWNITLTCTQAARRYIFNIENIGYLQYRLRNVINLTSRYSYVMFMYLENNRFRKEWDVSLDDLKRMMKCTGESYDEFKIFNARILKACQRELEEKTSIRYSYSPLKRGRRVNGIHFCLKTRYEQVEEIIQAETRPEPANEMTSFLADAVENAFSEEQMEYINMKLTTLQLDSPLGSEIAKYDFLRENYIKMKLQEKDHKINNRYQYFLKMIGATT